MKHGKTAFIPEIQGLRTLALLMVATFHIWFDQVSGGVDVFLLVSAYLMTRSLTAASERGSITRPITYLLRKFSRLLPAAAAVIALILVGVLLFSPQPDWQTFFRDATHSLLYTENFNLQITNTDYFAITGTLASPFQHFWSLSIQGQIFVLFAVIHFIADLFARRTGISVRSTLIVVFSVLAVTSFGYAIWLTAVNQPFAYFDTGARIWEFCVGSLLALVSPWVRLPSALRVVFSWLGITAMLLCGFILPVESSFPGWAALWPVTAASLIILSIGERTRFGGDRFLALPVFRFLGGYTYALYLVHWPVLILALSLWDVPQAGPRLGLIVLTVSALVSAVIVHAVERPTAKWVRKEKRTQKRWLPQVGWRTPVNILTCLALVFGVTAYGNFTLAQAEARAKAAFADLDFTQLGANSPPHNPFDATPFPSPSEAATDWSYRGAGCASDDPYYTELCYEHRAADEADHRQIFSIGSSHNIQLNGAIFESVIRNPNWSLRTQISFYCYYENREEVGPECVELWELGARYIAEEQPDLVVLYGTRSQTDHEMIQPSLASWIAAAQQTSPSTQFVVVRDNPRTGHSMMHCADQNGFLNEECFWNFTTETPPDYIAQLTDLGLGWIDLNHVICPDQVCRPSQGGLVTYFDGNHLTNTYTQTLAPHLSRQIAQTVPWWPADTYAQDVQVLIEH